MVSAQHREQEPPGARRRRRWCRGRARASRLWNSSAKKPPVAGAAVRRPKIVMTMAKTRISSEGATVSQAISAGVPRDMRVVEHVAEPVAEARLLLRRRLDRGPTALAPSPWPCGPAAAVPCAPWSPLRSPAGRRCRTQMARTILPHPARRRHWHDRAMRPTSTAIGWPAGPARAGLRHPGPGVHQPDHPAAAVLRPWDLSEVELSLLLLMMVLLAGAGSVVAELVAKRSDSARTLRAGLLIIGDRRARARGRAPRCRVFVAGLAVYGVGLGIVDATTQHAGGRARAPLRAADPAVVPRRLDLRRHHRRRLRARDGATCRSWPAGAGRGASRSRRPRAPYLRRDHGEALAAAEQVAVPWRPILLVGLGDGALLHGRHGRCRPGDRCTSTHLRTARAHWSRWRRSPYLVASGVCGWPATAWWRGSARCWCCASARWWRRWRWPSWCSRRPGRWRSLGFTLLGRRCRGDRAAELLGRGPDRRRRGLDPAPRPGWTR